MSADTTFSVKGRQFRISGPIKAAIIYVGMDVCISTLSNLGQTLYELKPEDWASWWGPKRFGWAMIQTGAIATSALLTLKAFFSNSSKGASALTEHRSPELYPTSTPPTSTPQPPHDD